MSIAKVHFTKGPALVLPISYREYERLLRQLQQNGKFFHVSARSNQLVAVRRAAVTDVYLAEGPQHDSWPSSPDYWRLVEDLLSAVRAREDLEAEYGKDTVSAIANVETLNRMRRLAMGITWQLSDGNIREGSAWETELDQFWWIEYGDPREHGSMIIVECDDAQTAFINPDALDYISIPEHRYRATVEAAVTSLALPVIQLTP